MHSHVGQPIWTFVCDAGVYGMNWIYYSLIMYVAVYHFTVFVNSHL